MAHTTAAFRDRLTAQAAVEQLAQAGFSREHISVLLSEATHAREFGPTTSQGVLGGIMTALLLVRRHAVLAAGPVVPALEDWAGGLASALRALGVPEDEADAAYRRVHQGDIVVDVSALSDRLSLARELLSLAGGESPLAA